MSEDWWKGFRLSYIMVAVQRCPQSECCFWILLMCLCSVNTVSLLDCSLARLMGPPEIWLQLKADSNEGAQCNIYHNNGL